MTTEYRERKPATAGEIELKGGHKFLWMLSGDGTEVYGSIELPDRRIKSGSGGWWRTADPNEAARLAESTL